MKASAFTSARLTRDRITIAKTIRATAITIIRRNIGRGAGTGGMIGTITTGIDAPSAETGSALFSV